MAAAQLAYLPLLAPTWQLAARIACRPISAQEHSCRCEPLWLDGLHSRLLELCTQSGGSGKATNWPATWCYGATTTWSTCPQCLAKVGYLIVAKFALLYFAPPSLALGE